ncbi:hypothetical protein E4U57_004011 [Claviceps arundinis]|uniref:Uncharacterized protein n=1 Tax=Claviceps arundinis TaxID=1623583 RepID=A0ABQ7PN53_9HYPO|nr:hypothetical protein E4U57_004011 [Claviceps arundinis]
MAATGIMGSGGIKNARYTRHKDARGIRDIPEGKNNDQVSVDPRAKIGRHDLVKSRPGNRGGGSGCDVGVATRATGATTTETDTQSETATVTGSATVTASVTTGYPVTDFSGQGFADGKIAVRNAPRHPPSTPLKFSLSLDGHESTIESTALAVQKSAIENRIPTAVAIALATVAGVALLAAAVFLWMLCRRRRSCHLISRKAKPGISAPSVPIALKVLPCPCTYQSSASPAIPAPIAKIDRSIRSAPTFATNTAAPECLLRPSGSSGLSSKDVRDGGGPWWRSYSSPDVVKPSNNKLSTPLPRLMERKMHPSIYASDSSISSPNSTPTKSSGHASHRRGGHVRGRHAPFAASNLTKESNWQLPISPATSAHPPLQDDTAGVTTYPAFLITNTTYEYSSFTSPPRTSGRSNIRGPILDHGSPGPPPNRALLSPPVKDRHTNSLSPPAKPRVNTLRREEVGVALGSGPSNLGIPIEKPYYQVWNEASQWQPPPSSTPGDNMFSKEWI